MTPAKGILGRFSTSLSFAEKQWLKINKKDKLCPGKYQTLWARCSGYQLPPAQGSVCTCLCVSGMQVRLGLHLAASFTPSNVPGTIVLVRKPARGETLGPLWALDTDNVGPGRKPGPNTPANTAETSLLGVVGCCPLLLETLFVKFGATMGSVATPFHPFIPH